MTRVALLVWALLAGVAGCSHDDALPGSAAPARDASRASAPDAAAGASSANDGGAEAGAAPSSWSGTYKAAPGTLDLPEALKVRWHSDDATSGVGEGTLTLSVDPQGAVNGTLEGPLGPAVIDGYLADGVLSATIGRRDAHDHGFAGVLTGKAGGGKIEGVLNASPATAGAVRTGTFSVAPSGPAPGP